MPQRTDAQLITEASFIRYETLEGANTAARVGNMLYDIIDSKLNKQEFGLNYVLQANPTAQDKLMVLTGTQDPTILRTMEIGSNETYIDQKISISENDTVGGMTRYTEMNAGGVANTNNDGGTISASGIINGVSYTSIYDSGENVTSVIENRGFALRFYDDSSNNYTYLFASVKTNGQVQLPPNGTLVVNINGIEPDYNGIANYVTSKYAVSFITMTTSRAIGIGYHEITQGSTNSTCQLNFPPPSGNTGKKITIVQRTSATLPTYIGAGLTRYRGAASDVSQIAAGEMWQFISNGSYWIGGKLS